MSLNSGQQGTLRPNDVLGDFNALRYLAMSIMEKMETATLVEVISCTNTGGVSPVGYVDVQPLVDKLDGDNRPVAHPQISNLPYFRIQGGTNAVIIDPEPGDIGIAVFASRDISSVKSKKGQATPGSRRKYSLSDGLYIGGVLNGTPTQYIQFNGSGITVYSATKATINAPAAEVDCQTAAINATTSLTVTSPQTTFNGKVTITGLVTGQGGIAMSGGSGAQFNCSINSTGDISASTSLKVAGKEVNGHTHTDPQGGNVGEF